VAVTQPKQRGIRKSVISTKLDDATIAKIDQFAETTDSTRSAAVAALIEVGLGGKGEVEKLITENHSLREKIGKGRAALR
jgi:hypothetical protein